MKIDANLYFCSQTQSEDPGTTRNMKLNCQVECNANKDGSERKLLEIFGEIVTMMEREGAQSDCSQSQDNKYFLIISFCKDSFNLSVRVKIY